MKLFLAILSVFLLVSCGGGSVKEEFDTDGKVMSRTYKGVNADYALYANKFEALQSQQKPLFEMKSVAGQTIKLEGVEALTVNAPSNPAAQLAPPPPKQTVLGEIRAGLREFAPWLKIVADWDNANEREVTNRFVTQSNNNRELGTVQAIAQRAPTSTTYTYENSFNQRGHEYNNAFNTPTETNTTITTNGDGNATGEGNSLINGANANNSGTQCQDQSCIEAPVVVVAPVVPIVPVVVTPAEEE